MDLPDPDSPTTAMLRPGGSLRDSPSSTSGRSSAHRTRTPCRRRSYGGEGGGRGTDGSVTAGSASSSAKRRCAAERTCAEQDGGLWQRHERLEDRQWHEHHDRQHRARQVAGPDGRGPHDGGTPDRRTGGHRSQPGAEPG